MVPVKTEAQEYGAVNIIATAPEGILFIKDLRHKDPEWKFAGGHVEKGETHAYAAMRELKEETGLVAHIKDKHRIRIRKYTHYSKSIYLVNQPYHFESLYKISPDWELVRVFSPEEIRGMGIKYFVPEHYKQLEELEII